MDIGNQEIIDVNRNAKGQVLSFDISLNGKAPADGVVTIPDNKNPGGLAKVEDWKLVVEYKEGVKNGEYKITLQAGDAKTNVRIKVSSVPLVKCIKLKEMTDEKNK